MKNNIEHIELLLLPLYKTKFSVAYNLKTFLETGSIKNHSNSGRAKIITEIGRTLVKICKSERGADLGAILNEPKLSRATTCIL